MDRIKGKPEGRKGVWLLGVETAVAIIESLASDEVHNLIGGNEPFEVGADWKKEDAVAFLRDGEFKKIALVFYPRVTFKHQLVVINSCRRWSFDVGVIEEYRMEEAV